MSDKSVIVKTTGGDVRGHRSGGTFRFYGVPYGSATGSAARFMPPRPVEPWTGVLDAVINGPSCPQPNSDAQWMAALRERIGGFDIVPMPGAGVKPDESCLVTNVWTPAADDGGRPVMVWLHAGAWTIGAGTSDFYDGERLATRGDVVVVTFNHRIGPLGFANLADVGGADFRSSGNTGLLDIVLALEWIRDNIARFGGDPGNITLFGESGGGRKGTFALALPAARGLFHRVIIQSGAQLHALSPAMTAKATADAMAGLGLGSDDIRQFQNTPPGELLAAVGNGWGFQPIVDGDVLPRHPLDAIEAGIAADVPVIVGTTRDESAMWLVRQPSLQTADSATLLAELRARLGPEYADRVMSAYQARSDAREVFCAALTDRDRRIPAIRLAEALTTHHRSHVYMYVFAYPGPVAGPVFHAMDLPYTFDVVGADRPDYAMAQRVADQFSGAWLAFARTGDPNHRGIPYWAPYDLRRRATMCFGPTASLVDDPLGAERAAWDGLLPNGISSGLPNGRGPLNPESRPHRSEKRSSR